MPQIQQGICGIKNPQTFKHLTLAENNMTNKNLVDYYMSLPYNIHVERFEQWGDVSYKASVLEFENCEIFGLTEEFVRSTIPEIMRIWIKTRLDLKDMDIPKPYGY